MITGNMSCTHGEIIYGNKKLDDVGLTELSLGYCHQYNSVWKLLTVEETVKIYLKIC
eukprot:jgi/Orpsp1_1/1178802/evm.model.c7180000066796.1